MTAPALPNLIIEQTYAQTRIAAFNDITSGSSDPVTCGTRTCTSNNPNVVWDDANQQFTV
jgi:hypothetical protein